MTTLNAAPPGAATSTNGTPVPAILQPAGVSGGGGGDISPQLRQALEALHGALGALRGALEGAAQVSGGGGGGASGGGCGCGGGQATSGAGALGAPAATSYRGANGAPEAERPKERDKPRRDEERSDAARSSGGGSAPSGTKLRNPLEGAKKTSSFGAKEAIRNGRAHGGLDLAKPTGAPIVAAAAGKVVEVSNDSDGYGNYVTIDHGNGRYTRYAHMVERSPLKVGETVDAGAQVGKVGSTGNSTGPHLHFEVLIGGLSSSNRTDPAPYLTGDKTL